MQIPARVSVLISNMGRGKEDCGGSIIDTANGSKRRNEGIIRPCLTYRGTSKQIALISPDWSISMTRVVGGEEDSWIIPGV